MAAPRDTAVPYPPTRTLIRLKHSLAADQELNDVLPDTLGEFDEALARGELRELRASLDDVLDDVAWQA